MSYKQINNYDINNIIEGPKISQNNKHLIYIKKEGKHEIISKINNILSLLNKILFNGNLKNISLFKNLKYYKQ